MLLKYVHYCDLQAGGTGKRIFVFCSQDRKGNVVSGCNRFADCGESVRQRAMDRSVYIGDAVICTIIILVPCLIYLPYIREEKMTLTVR